MPKDANEKINDIPHTRNEKRPDFSSKPLPERSVPRSIQETLDNDEKLWALLYEGRFVFPFTLKRFARQFVSTAMLIQVFAELKSPPTQTSAMLAMPRVSGR